MHIEEFFSYQEMENEFGPSLESTMGANIPGHWWPKYLEAQNSGDKHLYLLFFNDRDNTPFAYAQCRILKDEKGRTLAKWQTTNPTLKSYLCELRQLETFVSLFLDVIKKVEERFDCHYSYLYDERVQTLNAPSISQTQSSLVPETIIKKYFSYQEYINSFAQDKQKLLSLLWKDCHKKLKLEIGEYLHFKEVFHYRPETLELYKELNKLSIIKTAKNHIKAIRTVHYMDMMVGMLLFFQGKSRQLFCYNLSPYFSRDDFFLPESFFSQLAVFTFYDLEAFDKLILLPDEKMSFEHWNLDSDPYLVTSNKIQLIHQQKSLSSFFTSWKKLIPGHQFDINSRNY